MKFTYKFDFDHWMALNIESPDKFEIERRKFIVKHIDNFPSNKRRLEAIQFRVDVERGKSKSPMGACIRLSGLLMDYFCDEFVAALNDFCSSSEK